MRKLSLQCLVLDEGHMLKNMASQRYSHLMKIKVRYMHQCVPTMHFVGVYPSVCAIYLFLFVSSIAGNFHMMQDLTDRLVV